MHELYELKDTLMDELEQYTRKGEINAKDLEVVDKLTHTIKNLCKIIESYEEEEGYSSRGSYYNNGGYNNSMRGGSYARGRTGNVRRDSRGRYSNEGYSRNNDMVSQLRELMMDAPDEQTKMEFQRFISKMESM